MIAESPLRAGVAEPGPVPVGNLYDKYGSGNPLVRRLMAGFHAALDEIWPFVPPESVLDVGCGEGVMARDWAERLGEGRVVGVDLDHPGLRQHWATHGAPNLEFRVADAASLPFRDGEFDLAAAIESLEHVPQPEATLAEMARVARRHLLVSVPREPLWRMANVARGAYVRSFGNTPGHLNHWSRGSFRSLLERYGSVEAVRSPFPWTLALVRLGDRR